ncbi:MerR family transcriptional regulator [Dactylosporangium sp. McL0621]|uniref:MerR family transcriptional regulator n=1 Tax=Dactylosporangium sp. McL0621 TaxID=3415678 RepID=UPI003CEB9FF7
MTAQEWTLDELIGKVAERLDDTAYAGAPNGRVREVPDARAVRWYTTIGLVDRPAMRGRTAWYGPRHLAQLVAIKRRQSQGFKIAEIQAELAEAPDEVLQRIADLTDVNAKSTATPRRFWVQRPADYARTQPGLEQEDNEDGDDGDGDELARRKPSEPARPGRVRPEPGDVRPELDGRRPALGRKRPELGHVRPEVGRVRIEPGHLGPESDLERPEAGRVRIEPGHVEPGHVGLELGSGPVERVPPERARPDQQAGPAVAGLLSGVPLGGGAVLLLNTTPTEDDLEAIRVAARELMDLLATRGLVTPDETTTRRGNAK